MSCVPTLQGSIPNEQAIEVVEEQILLLEEQISSESISSDIKIQFPSGYQKIPLIGGAVISFGIKNFKIKTNRNVIDVLTRDLNEISKLKLKYSLNSLSNLQTMVNKLFYDIARKDFKIIDEKKKAPSLYLSIFRGEDKSAINQNVYVSGLNKVCEFRYIPVETFRELMGKIKMAQGYLGDKNTLGFSEMVGTSGRKFSTLDSHLLKTSLSDSDITDFLLEFFPIINISDDSITSQKINIDLGGYYTIANDSIFLKLPDLSGRDSSGVSSNYIKSEDSLFLEMYNNATASRIEIKEFVPPTVGAFDTLDVMPDDFPNSNSSLELKVSVINKGSESLKLYLSPLLTRQELSEKDYPYNTNLKGKFINGYNQSIEAISVPILTLGIEEGREPIIDSTKHDKVITASLDAARKYFPSKKWYTYLNTQRDFSYINIDYAKNPAAKSEITSTAGRDLLVAVDPYAFFGIKNRPEVMLSPENGSLDKRNNSKYLNISSYGKINILSSFMPKIVKNIPSSWISSELVFDLDSDSYVARIPYSELEGIDLSKISGEVRFAAYIGDEFGQLTKVSGPIIQLANPKPIITQISPNGFDESGLITFDTTEDIVLQIFGEDLDQVSKVNLKALNSGIEISYDISMDQFQVLSPTLIFFTIAPGFLSQDFSQVSQKYSVTLTDKVGNKSIPEYIYITALKDDQRPRSVQEEFTFLPSDIYSSYFGTGPILGIPLFSDGNSALINIESKNKIFKNNYEFYVYIGLPTGISTLPNAIGALDSSQAQENRERLEHFAFPDRIFKVNLESKVVSVPIDIFHIMKGSPTEDFYRINDKKAAFRFPGKKYSNYNFSILNGIKDAYFIITNLPLNNFSQSELLNTAELETRFGFSYSYLKIGNGASTPAFIDPYSITDIAIKDVNGISATFPKDKYSRSVYSEDFEEDFSIKDINTSGRLKSLLLVVSGIDERNLSSKYDFFLDGKNISNKISKKPIPTTGGKLIFEFKNVSPTKAGILSLKVVRKRSPYISRYESDSYNTQATLILGADSGTYSIDENSNLIVKSYLDNLEITTASYFIENFDTNYGTIGLDIVGLSSYVKTNPLVSFYRESLVDGAIFNEVAPKSDTIYTPFNPIAIKSSSGIKLRDGDGNDIIIDGINRTEGIKSLRKYNLSLLENCKFSTYIQSEGKFFLLFITNYNYGFASIKCDVPVIIRYGRLGEELREFVGRIRLIAGEVYRFLVKNVGRFFEIIINGNALRPESEPEFDSESGGYIATITIPVDFASLDILTDEITIGTSVANEELNRAEYDLGVAYIETIEENCNKAFERLIDPDTYNKIKLFPLSFTGLKLDLPLPLKLAVKSFCDLSFDLTKELKFALNGFRTLMIPVQVIFSIIDVICSLLNPVKLARAVIRLFEGLYDLVSLLPSISIPVMFLELALHTIELFSCVFDKIGLTLRAINDIFFAFKRVLQKPVDYTAIKSLEETLEQYLDDIDLDLKYLDPIVSILDIFLQLLQIIFRFPCKVSPLSNEDDIACGMDGTILAGLVVGLVAPNSTINPEFLIPVAQSYSIDPLGSTQTVVDPTFGTVVATRDEESSYYDSLNINEDSLRADGNFSFDITTAPCYTKVDRKGKKVGRVEFEFNYRAETTTLRKVNIDPNQTTDAPFALFNEVDDTELTIGNLGNMFSPIDGAKFLDINISQKKATVKPLTLTFEVPITQINSTTGQLEQVGTQEVVRTFDNVPMMAIIDDESNVYFIEKEGIEYNNDGYVNKITARIINSSSAPKHKFSKEDQEIDGEVVGVYDFPQIYFFDMRQIGNDLQQYCITSSINSFPLEDNNTDDILNIVQSAQDCLFNWRQNISNIVSRAREEQQSGLGIFTNIDLEQYNTYNQNVVECLNLNINDVCKYAVNSLNTSFKILEDNDPTPKKDYVDGLMPETILEGFSPSGPAFTGAREYAAGIGDNAIIDAGSFATIEIIPRDIHDNEIGGNFSEGILVEIISDTTGGAQLISDENGKFITKVNNTYIAKLTSNGAGEVKIRAQICDRTIQALIYQGMETEAPLRVNPGCVRGTPSELSETSPPIGSLTKVDRILVVYFRDRVVVSTDVYQNIVPDEAVTEPQEFGTALEN